MSNVVGMLIVRLTHTGVYADGRPNTSSVTIYDLDQDILKMNRARSVPVPPGGFIDVPMSSETLISYSHGSIAGLAREGLIRVEVILQLRDKDHFGGPAGTGQTLRPVIQNIERVGGFLRLVIPNNALPGNSDSSGYLTEEHLQITGLVGNYRALNGSYTISSVTPGSGLAGVDAASYLVVVPSAGPNIAAEVHPAGVVLRLTDGRITVEFTSDGNLGGLGANVFGYVAGQLLPGTGGGGGTLAQVLVLGDTTGGTDIVVSSGDSILGQTDLVLSPGGAGGDNLILDGLTWPDADGAAGTALVTNGLGVLSFAAPAPAAHATTHVRSGTDPVDGDLLDVDYVPANYVRTLTPPTTSLEELTSHLRGIDLALGAAGGAATAILEWGTISVSASTATRFLSPTGDLGLAPLVPVSWAAPRGGTIRNLRIRHNNPTGNGNLIVYTVRVNGVNTTVSVSIASTAANGSDVINSVVVVAGDLIDIVVTKALAIGDGTVSVIVTAEMAA